MIDREKREFYNAAGFVQNGKIQKIYRKIKLAPFGEYLPMQDFLFSLGLSTIVPNTVGSFIRGTEHTVYDFGKVKTSVLICYDGTFSENVREFVKNGSELLLNISNDAWFGYSSETFQLGSFYPFRAVETGRTIVRAANVGISGVILPDGSTTHDTKLFERTVINPVVPIYEFDTIYLKFGNWFLYLVFLATGVVVFMSFRKNREVSQKLKKEEVVKKMNSGKKRSKK
jgi:apolipoprotein N-acyltransferase